MAALKGREIDRFIASPDFSYAVFLVYGPDQGLVSERADRIAAKSGVDTSDPFNMIRLSADEATADPLKITDEANTIGMFGGKRLIRVSGRTQRDLFKSLKPVLDAPPPDTHVLVEAGDLARSSGLRKGLEKNAHALCIPCYQDNAAALEALIDEEITGQGLKIDRETRSELRGLLGDNRMLSRNELKKLALYCEGRDQVRAEDVRALVGDASALIANDIVDAAATGNPGRLQVLLPKAIEAGTSPDIILQGCLRHFQMLHRLRVEMESGGKSSSALIDSVRPPIHFTRKGKVSDSLKIWTAARLLRAQQRLDSMMLECRRNAGAASAISGTALLAIALEAQALHRR